MVGFGYIPTFKLFLASKKKNYCEYGDESGQSRYRNTKLIEIKSVKREDLSGYLEKIVIGAESDSRTNFSKL